MTILDDFWDEYRKMLLIVIFFHYGNAGDKVAAIATGPKQNQLVVIKLPPTPAKCSAKSP